MPYFAPAAITFALTGLLATSVAAGDFVPVGQVIRDMRDTPYECADYDPATDSCSSVSIMRWEEVYLLNTSWFALPNSGGVPWVFEVDTDYEVVMGWGCRGNASAVAVAYSSGGQPELGETYAQQIRAQLVAGADPDEPCAGYYQTGPGRYRLEFRHYTGERAQQAATEVQFFAAPKAVRP